MIGTKLGRYRIIEKIGAGGMGDVYLAHDERLERDVAVKVMGAVALADDTARRQFRKEALALSKLNHPNIATVHEFDTQDGVDFLVMEYVTGVTLSDRLVHGPLPEQEVLRLGSQLAEGLATAHEHGVVHRDLKPGNLRVLADGRLKILDFGLARLLARDAASATAATQSATGIQAPAGTLPYMAPEQLRSEEVDHRSDIWAAGVVIYESATGRRPFESRLTTALAADIQTKPPVPPSRVGPVSPELEQIVLKCLEKDPDLRYQSARDLLADFRRRTAGGGPAAQAASRRAFPRVQGRFVIAALAILAALITGLVVTEMRRRESSREASAPRIASLAVLPLANLSGEPGHEYLVDGLQEALIMELSRIGALRVISRPSTARYKGGDTPLPQVARELNVDAVVTGAVLRAGNRLRVSAQLIQVEPERHLWADHFDRELTDVLYLTSDVAQTIARQIRVTLTPTEQARLARARPVNAEAYELYAFGRHHWSQRTIDGYRYAIESFRKALALDAGYAPAYSALAESYMLLGEQGGMPQTEARPLAAAAIRTALDLDPNLAEAHASLGHWKFFYEWNWTESEQAFKRAIELNPGYAAAHHLYGRTLAFIGRFEDALNEIQRARELDPLSILVHAYTAQVYLFARQHDRAAGHLERALQLNPNHALIRHNLGEVYLAQRRFADAIGQLEQSVALSREPSLHYLAMLGCAYARANRRTEALEILTQLTDPSKRALVSSFDMASLHAALGAKEQALDALEAGYAQRDIWLVELKVWPWFDSLADDPRFQALLRRMAFPA